MGKNENNEVGVILTFLLVILTVIPPGLAFMHHNPYYLLLFIFPILFSVGACKYVNKNVADKITIYEVTNDLEDSYFILYDGDKTYYMW